ncbi:MAG: putative sensor protein [Frankiales bacterium]|nr:putative sensor protein [Frankiales bacterium]
MSFGPFPVSGRDSRRFLRAFLSENAVAEERAEAAELALSEVVTNAVLHAHTEFTVALSLALDGGLRVEVMDHDPQLPVQRGYAEQATTGRGMELVWAYTHGCGVESRGPAGKTVWFVLNGEPLPGEPQDDVPDPWDIGREDVAEAAAGSDVVVLLGLPPTLWLAAREHHDAVLRELALWAAEHPDQAPDPARIALADHARAWISTRVVAELDRLASSATMARRAVHKGRLSPLPDTPESFDLEVPVPEDAASAFGALQDALDAAEALAVRGLLLARPGLPEIIAVRDWACEQAISQQAGVLPSPWPGTGQDRFTHEIRDREEHDPPQWDARLVADSDRGAVAADDANRIIAVSRPLARALGWDVHDLVGRRVVVLVPPHLREAHVAGFTRHLTTGETHVVGVPLRLPVLRADGTQVECGFLIEQTPVTSGRAVYIAWIDPPDEPAGSAG